MILSYENQELTKVQMYRLTSVVSEIISPLLRDTIKSVISIEIGYYLGRETACECIGCSRRATEHVYMNTRGHKYLVLILSTMLA